MNFLSTVWILFLTSCAMMGAPGSVSVNKSDYDGTKELYMKPGWANNGLMGSLKIGFQKNSKMNKDDAIMIVRNDTIKNFAFKGPNFLAKVDGEEYKFSPIERKTDCNTSTQSDVAHCIQ